MFDLILLCKYIPAKNKREKYLSILISKRNIFELYRNVYNCRCNVSFFLYFHLKVYLDIRFVLFICRYIRVCVCMYLI